MLFGTCCKTCCARCAESGSWKTATPSPLRYLSEFREALDLAVGNALHLGVQDAIEELQRAAKQTGEEFNPEWPEVMGLNLTGPNGEEVSEEFRSTRKEIEQAWRAKVPIQRKLLAMYSRESYTVTGVLRDDLLRGSKRIISKGIRRGASYQQVAQELDDYFKPYVDKPGAVDAGVRKPYRLMNIARTNMAEAYNSGRMNLYKSKEVGDFIVAYEYSAIMDDRTTEFCKEWDGEILPANDSRIGANNPPNHYQCRSVWIPITRGERHSLSENPPGIQPAEGFLYTTGEDDDE